MRSLFDRGPSDNYMPPSIIRPTGASLGGGAVIERTMANRESRQGGTMRGGGGMGFINRGSSLGTGIDYGTFSGPGAGGARFYGEGVVRLKRGGGSVRPPFTCVLGPEQSQVTAATSGFINGVPLQATTAFGVAKGKFVALKIDSSQGAVTAVNLSVCGLNDLIQQPTEGHPPPIAFIPIYSIPDDNGPVRLVRLIADRMPFVFMIPSEHVFSEANGCGAVAITKYTWAIGA